MSHRPFLASFFCAETKVTAEPEICMPAPLSLYLAAHSGASESLSQSQPHLAPARKELRVPRPSGASGGLETSLHLLKVNILNPEIVTPRS